MSDDQYADSRPAPINLKPLFALLGLVPLVVIIVALRSYRQDRLLAKATEAVDREEAAQRQQQSTTTIIGGTPYSEIDLAEQGRIVHGGNEASQPQVESSSSYQRYLESTIRRFDPRPRLRDRDARELQRHSHRIRNERRATRNLFPPRRRNQGGGGGGGSCQQQQQQQQQQQPQPQGSGSGNVNPPPPNLGVLPETFRPSLLHQPSQNKKKKEKVKVKGQIVTSLEGNNTNRPRPYNHSSSSHLHPAPPYPYPNHHFLPNYHYDRSSSTVGALSEFFAPSVPPSQRSQKGENSSGSSSNGSLSGEIATATTSHATRDGKEEDDGNLNREKMMSRIKRKPVENKKGSPPNTKNVLVEDKEEEERQEWEDVKLHGGSGHHHHHHHHADNNNGGGGGGGSGGGIFVVGDDNDAGSEQEASSIYSDEGSRVKREEADPEKRVVNWGELLGNQHHQGSGNGMASSSRRNSNDSTRAEIAPKLSLAEMEKYGGGRDGQRKLA